MLNVKLMYNFLYLMTDGSTGFIETTTYGGGTKTPIAVVVSRSKRLAIALKDAGGEAKYKWYSLSNYYSALSKKCVNWPNFFQTPMQNGEEETWQASASYDNTTVKGTSPNYPAFKVAAEYTPTLPTGVQITGSMATKKWFLPSTDEWRYMYTALCFGSSSPSPLFYDLTYANLANTAFTQVGGSKLQVVGGTLSEMTNYYWSSTEYYHNHRGHALAVVFIYRYPYTVLMMTFQNDTHKNIELFVRPFIYYP